jgi:hypothetical protein
VDSLRVLREQYESAAAEPVAVRGDRLAVHRVSFRDAGGNELVVAAAVEMDESGCVVRLVHFDDEIAAIDLLDEWYLEGEGAADADVLSSAGAFLRTYHDHDWTGLRERMAPDFEFVDHRPLPWPLSDADGLIRLMQERIEQVPDLLSRIRKVFVQGRAVLSVGEAMGSDQHGGLQRWPMLNMMEFDAAGATRRIEYFAPEQFDDALARFDELDAAAPLENAAVRVWALVADAFAVPDWERCASLVADDIVNEDRRSGVNSGIDTGSGAVLALVRGLADVGYATVTYDVLAVRGDRLALGRRRWARDDGGFDLEALSLLGVDDDGRLALSISFDADDVAGAMQALDEVAARLDE